MLLDKNPMGYWTYLNLNVIILIVSFKMNLDFKIQMLVEKSLISFLNASSEESSTLYCWLVEENFFIFLKNFYDIHFAH